MFDGNYRSRRTVNLSSGKRSRKSGTGISSSSNNSSNKQALLEQSRIKREERKLANLKAISAPKIQCIYRGYYTRKVVQIQLEDRLHTILLHNTNTNKNNNNNNNNIVDNATIIFNFLFRLIKKNKSDREKLYNTFITNYATYIKHFIIQQQKQQHTPPRAHRILQMVLKHTNNSNNNNNILTIQDELNIISYALDIPFNNNNMQEEKSNNESYYYWNRASDNGFLLLVTCTNTALLPFLSKCIQWSVPDTIQGQALQVTQILINYNNDNENENSNISINDNIDLSPIIEILDDNNNNNSSNTTTRKKNGKVLSDIVQKLISEQYTKILHTIATKYKFTKDINALANAVRLYKLILLDNNNNNNSSTLLWTMNRIIKGETPNNMTDDSDINKDNSTDESDDDDDEDDDGRVHAEEATVNPSSKSTARFSSSTSSRLTKADLQTLPKLDRLHTTNVLYTTTKWHSNNILQNQNNNWTLASTLADSTLLSNWGNALFPLTIEKSDYDNNKNYVTLLRQAQDTFITLLLCLFQATTGLRPGQNASTCTLLNKLAFSSTFISGLWTYFTRVHYEVNDNKNNNSIEDQQKLETTLYIVAQVFADIFTHYLIALKDDQFIQLYTTTDNNRSSGTDKSGRLLLADMVIICYRQLLYETYWTKPVQISDMKIIITTNTNNNNIVVSNNFASFACTNEQIASAVRGRFIISGTKLWNSLYERWCRLVRNNPFCEESIWWFPPMTTLVNDSRAVVDNNNNRLQHQNRGNQNDQDNDPMHIDDESDDSDMEEDDDDEMSDLADAFADPKMARVLTAIPFALPFDRRVKLFVTLLKADKIKTQDEASDMRQAMLLMMRGEEGSFSTNRERVTIHRDRLYDDSMKQLNQLGSKLKRKVQVSFINQHGAEEAGIDGGGVFKEFIDDLIRDAFSIENSTAQYQLFTVTPLQTLKVNVELPRDQSLLLHYEFLGRVLGKAVYESILVEPQFCLPFLNQLLGKSNTMEDLKNFDPEYYRNLTKLLSMNSNELDDLGLSFELNIGKGNNNTRRTAELLPGGRSKSVTKQNVVQYVHLVAHQLLNVQSSQQTKAFLRGFRDLIPASWVRLFSSYELQKLISGDDSIQGIDVTSLQRTMQYAAGYHPDQPIIKWFWEIINEMTGEQQHKFLRFMTSCSRQPLLGFNSLEPAPCIQQIRLPDRMFHNNDILNIVKEAPLPTSSTCMNLLKLPNYRSKELMRLKLHAAIESGAGFELT